MRVIGLMSGTSHDAIDAVAAEITQREQVLVVRLLGMRSRPYPPQLRAELLSILPPGSTDIATVCRLDTAIGQEFAAAAAAANDEFFHGTAELIAAHGQTVYHWVEAGHTLGTLQLGQPAWIAQRTGVPVVSDFRSRDIAEGGQGAPLVALFDLLWLNGRPGHAVALNIGGIANVTVTGTEPMAFDTGPGNALIDAVVQRATGGAEFYDRDGERAARGKVQDGLLKTLLAEPYYQRPAPKSTGKELFNADYLARLPETAVDDLVATLTALTAQTIGDAVSAYSPTELIASGGGTLNPTLLAMLRERVWPAKLRTSDELGLPSAAKEAAAFAVLGFLTVHGFAGTVAACTGARAACVLGSITPGANGLPTALPSDNPPRQLTVVSHG